MTVYTVGHSTRSARELVGLLQEASVRALVDVRRFPSSRRHPQHKRGALERALAGEGIRYLWLGESLGGRRESVLPLQRSANRACREKAFRHYADSMQTPEFREGIGRLEAQAREHRTAFMCAERDGSRCHRQLIADWLVVRGWRLIHLTAPGMRVEHALTGSARVHEGELSYPSLL